MMPSHGALSAIASYAIGQNMPPDTPFCIDIESWRSYTVGGGDTISIADAKAAISKYADTIKAVKLEAPQIQMGYFGAALPMEDGFYAISRSAHDSDIRSSALQKAVLMRKIAKESDILFPSCYTYSEDVTEWIKSFQLQIDMCKILSPSCKVIPFIWPQYPTPTPQLGGTFLTGAMWKVILEACYDSADGAAIYGEQSTDWSTAYGSHWWPQTQAFIIDKHLTS